MKFSKESQKEGIIDTLPIHIFYFPMPVICPLHLILLYLMTPVLLVVAAAIMMMMRLREE
jgi:hypothetical protein